MIKKVLVLSLLNLLFVSVVFSQNITPIVEIRENFADYDGQQVTIEGIITIGADILVSTRLQAFIQDESERGLMIHHGSLSAAFRRDFVRGNKLRMTGRIGEFNGAIQITNFTYEVLESDLDVPFVGLSIREALNLQTYEGTFVKISGTLHDDPRHVNNGFDVNIEDSERARINVRVWDNTNIDVSRLRVGAPITVYGAVGIFSNRSQILLGYQEDLTVDIQEPVIENITIAPTRPLVAQEITVTATIIDYQTSVQSASLEYRAGTQEDWTTIDMVSVGTDRFSAVIPPFNTMQSGEGEILFRIFATDTDDNVGTSGIQRIDVVLPRPIVSNVQIMNRPEAGESLIVRASIVDPDGYIKEARVLYTLNFSTSVHETEMTKVDYDIFEGVLPGFPSGTIVNISIWAIGNSSLTTIHNLDDEYNEVRYVFPIRTTEAILRIRPRAFNIFENERVEIGYFAKAGDHVTMRIYNSEGKLIVTPLNRRVSAQDGVNFYTWDGRNRDFRLVEPGLYICHIEVLDVNTGRKKADRAPIVIGTRLGR